MFRAIAPPRGLELGTSNGYSTLWLAEAARAVGSSLVSVEIDAARSALAHDNLIASGLDDIVDLRVEDAALTLSKSADSEWSFIFLDAERPAYVDYWPDLVRVLSSHGLLVVDNVLSHASELTDFRQLVTEDHRVIDVLYRGGAGALLITRAAAST